MGRRRGRAPDASFSGKCRRLPRLVKWIYFSTPESQIDGSVAQLVERGIHKPKVTGSIPVAAISPPPRIRGAFLFVNTYSHLTSEANTAPVPSHPKPLQ